MNHRERMLTTIREEATDQIPCEKQAQYPRNVVWFGESLPHQDFNAALKAAERYDLFMSIGTSSLVQPTASLPVVALKWGAVVVEINPDTTPLTSQVINALSLRSSETVAPLSVLFRHSAPVLDDRPTQLVCLTPWTTHISGVVFDPDLVSKASSDESYQTFSIQTDACYTALNLDTWGDTNEISNISQ